MSKETWYQTYSPLMPWESKHWRTNIVANAFLHQPASWQAKQARFASRHIVPNARAAIDTIYPPMKRQRTEQGSVPGVGGSSSFAGGVTKNSEELGGITATGKITGGGTNAPLTIKVRNRGKPWLTKFEDKRTSRFEKFFSPYWFYTYLMPNKYDSISQSTAAYTAVYEQGQNVQQYPDYEIGKINSMANITPAVAQNLSSNNQATSGWQGIHIAMDGWSQENSDAVFKVPVTQKRMTFRNPSNRRAHLKVYEFTCIKNGVYATMNPMTLWGNYVERKNVAAGNNTTITGYDTQITGFTCDPINPQTIYTMGKTPLCKDVNEFWKCTGKMNAYLLPGRNLEYTSTYGPRHINRMNYDQYVGNGDDAIAGWTTVYVVVAHGDTVAGVLPVNGDAELSAKSDYRISWTTDEQFATNYTYKEPTVKHYITSSLSSTVAPIGGIPHAIVPLANQRGVALTDTALQAETTDPYDNSEFLI